MALGQGLGARGGRAQGVGQGHGSREGGEALHPGAQVGTHGGARCSCGALGELGCLVSYRPLAANAGAGRAAARAISQLVLMAGVRTGHT